MKGKGIRKGLVLGLTACLLAQVVGGFGFGMMASASDVVEPDAPGESDPYKVMRLARESGEVSDNMLNLGTSHLVDEKAHDGTMKKVYKFVNPSEGSGGVGLSNNFQAAEGQPLEGVYTLSGWSKAENVQRGYATEYFSYCLMASVVYEDGTGQNFHTSFSFGTHDWEYREVSFNAQSSADQKIRNIVVYVFLRDPAYGTAWFDDIQLVKGNPDTTSTFQETPMQVLQTAPDQSTKETLKTKDGLEMGLGDSIVTSLKIDGTEIANNAYSGFLVRDVAEEENTGVYAFAPGSGSSPSSFKGSQGTLGLNIAANYKAEDTHIRVSGVIKDSTNAKEGRAVQLSYALPITASGWKWGNDILSSELIQADVPGNSYKYLGFGGHPVEDWDGPTHSTYPVSVIYNEDLGIAIAPSLEMPSYAIMEYNAGTNQYVLTYHLGIVPEAPDAAEFDFVIYKLDEPAAGFRASLKKYTQIFPDYFEVVEKDQGTWVAHINLNTVLEPDDFNFTFKEQDGLARADGAFEYSIGMRGYSYIEPGDWWPANLGKYVTADQVEAYIKELAKSPDKTEKAVKQAIATEFCKGLDINGNFNYNLSDAAWAPEGAQVHINANPKLPGEFNFYNMYINEETLKILFDPMESYGFTWDGIYLDELSGWWLGNANFNKAHYEYTTVPLTYSPYYKKPMLHRASNTWEFLQQLHKDLRAEGKTIFANKCPDKYYFNFRFVDAMGTEAGSQNADGSYAEPAHDRYAYYRTMAYQKAFCVLLTNNYDTFDSEAMAQYFQFCLLYGIFPSPSGNLGESGNQYFSSSERYYERDREVWQKYEPALKTLAEAGWEPVTDATANKEEIMIERYGEDAVDGVYFAVHNSSNTTLRTTISIPLDKYNLEEGHTIRELTDNKDIAIVNDQYIVTLQPKQTIAIAINNPKKEEPVDPSNPEDPTKPTSPEPPPHTGDLDVPPTGEHSATGVAALLVALSAVGAGAALTLKKDWATR